MTQLKNQNVLITGGARGIGFLMAQEAINKGARVILWDINEAGLADAVERLGDRAHGYVVDITDRHAVYAGADTVRNEVGSVDVLINNAGIVTGKSFMELPDEMIQRTFDVNAISLFWTARAFLPDMIKRNRGHVVTIASAAGLVGVTKLADYCASKFAAVGFNESLRVEMKKNAPGVRTTVVCPFYIDTGMFDGVKTRMPWLLPILKEEYVAQRVIKAVEKNKQRLFLPDIVQGMLLLKALPTDVLDFLTGIMGVNDTMDDFRGHDDKGGTNAQPPMGAQSRSVH